MTDSVKCETLSLRKCLGAEGELAPGAVLRVLFLEIFAGDLLEVAFLTLVEVRAAIAGRLA
jgi:hypothetical protein